MGQSDMFGAPMKDDANVDTQVRAVQSSFTEPSILGRQTEAFLPKHVHPVRRKNTHYHSTMGPTLGDNN